MKNRYYQNQKEYFEHYSEYSEHSLLLSISSEELYHSDASDCSLISLSLPEENLSLLWKAEFNKIINK